MSSSIEQTHSKWNALFAVLVGAISFAVYVYFLAPSVSFWDCGEYIASGASLGVPHPPGNPLYVMMCRCMVVLLPFFSDIGFRMNLLTPLFGMFTMAVVYLIIVRALVGWMGLPDTTWKRITVYVGAITGALLAAFSNTVMFTAVEAEVNMPQLLPLALNTWLGLVWMQSKSPNRDRYLLLISYIAFLGIALHMYSMTALLPVFVLVLIVDKAKRYDWRIWITGIFCGLVMMDVSKFLIFGGGITAISLISSFFGTAENRKKWLFAFFIGLFAILGFSANMYIPVRSALNPMIDENHPATPQAFRDYLDRKQYGSESMVTRMLHRRGQFSRQFGIEGHMGFGGFWLTQFFNFSSLDTQLDPQKGQPYLFTREGPGIGFLKLLVYLIPTCFLLYGLYAFYKKDKKAGTLLILMLFMTTIALVLYMNFADGTRSERADYEQWVKYGKQGAQPLVHREVRVRDYFWVGGFMFFGMWIGIAASMLMYSLFTSKKSLYRTTLAPMFAVLFAASPALPLSINGPANSRSGEFIPFDYAYNLLMTCAKDGILFTNGDNDTFPLWALQEAFGIRKDVRIINLSLANTDWYIRQLKNFEPKVPMSFTDKQIGELNHERNDFEAPFDYKLSNAGITAKIPSRNELNAFRIQDKLVLNVVDANMWKKPIYFAVTVSDDNKMGLDAYLQMQGLAYVIKPQPVPASERVDIERTVYLLNKVYRYRSLGDGKLVLNETSFNLLTNYAAGFITVALELRTPLMTMKTEIDADKAAIAAGKVADSVPAKLSVKEADYTAKLDVTINLLDQCVAIMPWEWRWRMLRQDVLMSHGKIELAEQRAREALIVEPKNAEYIKALGQALLEQGKTTEAQKVFKESLASGEDSWDTYYILAQNYEQRGQVDSAIEVIKQFADQHPGDRRAAQVIAQLQMQKNSMTPRVDSAKKVTKSAG